MSDSEDSALPDYFRRDQRDGVSPPDLTKECTYAEHIVHARGKRTQYTSVSLDPNSIRDLGEELYRFESALAASDGHPLIEHESLIAALRQVIQEGEKAERLRAIQALRYARRRLEGLIRWVFNISSVPRKDVITWAARHVQPYFKRMH